MISIGKLGGTNGISRIVTHSCATCSVRARSRGRNALGNGVYQQVGERQRGASATAPRVHRSPRRRLNHQGRRQRTAGASLAKGKCGASGVISHVEVPGWAPRQKAPYNHTEVILQLWVPLRTIIAESLPPCDPSNAPTSQYNRSIIPLRSGGTYAHRLHTRTFLRWRALSRLPLDLATQTGQRVSERAPRPPSPPCSPTSRPRPSSAGGSPDRHPGAAVWPIWVSTPGPGSTTRARRLPHPHRPDPTGRAK